MKIDEVKAVEDKLTPIGSANLANNIREWSNELGFQSCGISNIDLSTPELHLLNWLNDGFHGEMSYMERHGTKRSRPADLEPGTIRVISVRMDYFPDHADNAESVLNNPAKGYVSRYALGRDYHKLMRKRLQKLADRISLDVGPFGYRAFVDSAPVLEKALAEKAGLGWIGKHSNLLHKNNGSWFFLGEIYTDLPLAETVASELPESGHCGSCNACITACPTGAIVAPYRVDARKCISYLTIELKGSIPEELRPMMGNRIYGCDDCQLVCPFNKFSDATCEADFQPRHELDSSKLEALFGWDEATFLSKTEGSAIRRIGYQRWSRNIAVALGNALGNGPGNGLGNSLGKATANGSKSVPENTENDRAHVIAALESRLDDESELVREHVVWALAQQTG